MSDADALSRLMRQVAEGSVTPQEAASELRAGIADLGFARLDIDRARRTGMPEVVYGPGKSPAQLALLLTRLFDRHGFGFATRVEPGVADDLRDALDPARDLGARYDVVSKIFHVGTPLSGQGRGVIAVASAGTSDGAVAEEAAHTAELLGHEVDRINDIGVAGLHRVLGARERLEAAEIIIAVAGMEGALFSVLKGLVSRPVIAVPTSVGGGVSGWAALLSGLAACSSGVTVVGIDQGFSAGFAAAVINRRRELDG